MQPLKITNARLGEEYYYMKHPSGLNIYVYPKKGYSSTCAIFGTHFGSINNKFRTRGQENFTAVPDGIAHFLEHKLFDGKDGQDAFSLFSKTGASANAYTTWDKTAYYFSCTENFEKSLEILLNFVQHPYFDEKSVQKEQGIIGQEIKMYEDSPEWVVLINYLKALYKNHPINVDIAGTVESIAKITPDILYECYNAFYNLNNMSLCIVGNVDSEKIFSFVDKQLNYAPENAVESFFSVEPIEIKQKKITQKMDIASPLFYFGFKETPFNHTNKLYAQISIINLALSSKSESLYNELLKEELINTSSFSMDYMDGPGYSNWSFSGESKNAEKSAEIILKHIEKIKKDGVDMETFGRAKKMAYAGSLSIYNNVKKIANFLLDSSFYGREIFDYTEALSAVTCDDVNNHLKNIFNLEQSAISIVHG